MRPLVPRPLPTIAACAATAALLATGCGGKIEVSKSDQPAHHGAVLFNERCSGCHSLNTANAYGSRPLKTPLKYTERTNGPDFNTRKEDKESVLFAIRNGGFSGAIMPANIVVGQDAQELADFVSQNAGKK